MKNKIVIACGVVALAGLIYWGMTGSSAEAPLLQTENVANASDEDIVSTLLTLRAVSLSGTIFSDPVFMSLKDFGKEIVPEPVGRDNPFAPLPASAQPTAQTTQSAQIFNNNTGTQGTGRVNRGNLNIFNAPKVSSN